MSEASKRMEQERQRRVLNSILAALDAPKPPNKDREDDQPKTDVDLGSEDSKNLLS